MAISRIRRFEERQAKRRLFVAATGMLAILIFLAIFGLKILVGFSLLIDRVRGTTPTVPAAAALLLPPVLDPLPEATNSSHLNLTGKGESGLTLIIYLNEKEFKKLTLSAEGNFNLNLPIAEGANTVSAKHLDAKGNTSELSNVLTITLKKTKPKLEITHPEDGAVINGEKNSVSIAGLTDEDTQITINGRLVVVTTGSFSYELSLTEGENVFTVVATDLAGNQTTIERRVSYQH